MRDLIERQVAIDAAKKLYQGADIVQATYNDIGKVLVSFLELVPSAQERTGRWIDITKTGGDFVWKCSECGELNLEDTYYCPHCGARLMGVEHELGNS